MGGATRTGVFYSIMFAGTGVSLPYISLWLRSKGLSGAEIGVVLAAPMLARVFTGASLAVWADSFVLRRTALTFLGLTASASYLALYLFPGFGPALAAWFVAATCAGVMIPLTDVLTMRRSRVEGFSFARPRAAGSFAFIIANIAMGWILTRAPVDAIVGWIIISFACAALAARMILPPEPVHDSPDRPTAARFKGLGALLSDRVFVVAIVSVGLIQATHAFQYGFSSLVWKRQGLSEGIVGLLWGTGVAAEIAFLWFLEPWRRQVGPWRLLVLGGLAAVVRWGGLALAPPLWLLWPLQALHALSFAATFMAGLQIVERLTPRESATAAQTLNSSLSSGLLIGLATVASGPLYDRYGAGGYVAMAAIAMLGLAGAWQVRRPLSAA
jgi:PPP family 3-phenylpropionic acid transporter